MDWLHLWRYRMEGFDLNNISVIKGLGSICEALTQWFESSSNSHFFSWCCDEAVAYSDRLSEDPRAVDLLTLRGGPIGLFSHDTGNPPWQLWCKGRLIRGSANQSDGYHVAVQVVELEVLALDINDQVVAAAQTGSFGRQPHAALAWLAVQVLQESAHVDLFALRRGAGAEQFLVLPVPVLVRLGGEGGQHVLVAPLEEVARKSVHVLATWRHFKGGLLTLRRLKVDPPEYR